MSESQEEMKELIIVGARGLGRCVASQVRGDAAHGKDWSLSGFLDSGGQSVLPANCDIPVIGDPMTWVPRENQRFMPAVGNPVEKKKYLQPLIEKGALFTDLRTMVRVGDRANCAFSVVFGMNSEVSTDTTIDEYVYIDNNATIGHDCYVGRYSHIGAKTFVAGGVRIGECVTIHPGVIIGKGLTIGDNAVIGLGSIVMKDVPANAFVLGNPARVVRMLDVGLEAERQTD